jgi:acylphosphatase
MAVQIKHYRITGRVQGVGFRYFATKKAEELNLNGWVKNMPDGSVEVMLSGDDKLIEEMLKHLRMGPRSARVDDIEEIPTTGKPEILDGFTVRR